MNRNIFLAVGIFLAIFLGILLGIISFFKKIKRKKAFKNLKKNDVKEVEGDFKKANNNIINENTKEWENFNG